MAKRAASSNQDYYKVAGGETGRRTYAEQRKKLKKSTQSARMNLPPNPPDAVERKGVAAKGPAAETVRRGKKRATRKTAKESEEEGRHQVVERMAEGEAPSAMPGRMLPAAQRSTEVADFWRNLQHDVETIQRASRELVASVVDLVRAPRRALHLLRTVKAS